jgi:hypothetical protein
MPCIIFVFPDNANFLVYFRRKHLDILEMNQCFFLWNNTQRYNYFLFTFNVIFHTHNCVTTAFQENKYILKFY